jgi:hypothetical protein
MGSDPDLRLTTRSPKIRLLERPYTPGVVGHLNDYKLAVQLILLIERRETANTGDLWGELTAAEVEIEP